MDPQLSEDYEGSGVISKVPEYVQLKDLHSEYLCIPLHK